MMISRSSSHSGSGTIIIPTTAHTAAASMTSEY
jgi:hypothetical protein